MKNIVNFGLILSLLLPLAVSSPAGKKETREEQGEEMRLLKETVAGQLNQLQTQIEILRSQFEVSNLLTFYNIKCTIFMLISIEWSSCLQ